MISWGKNYSHLIAVHVNIYQWALLDCMSA